MTVSTLSELRATQTRHQQAGGNFLGCVIGWKVNRQLRIEHQQLVHLAQRLAVPGFLIPNPVKPAKAFRQGINKIKSLAKAQGLLLRYIGNKPTDEDAVIYVGLVEETADINAQTLDYDYLGVIEYQQGDFQSNIVNQDELLSQLREKFQFYQEHTSDDIYKILTQFAHHYAVRLTPAGGSYFVPATHHGVLQSLRRFLEVIDPTGQSKIFSFEMYDSTQNQSDLGEVAVNHLETEIQDLAEDLDDFLESAQRGRKSFENGLETRSQQLQDLNGRVAAFASVLNLQADLLESKLQQIQTQLDLRLSSSETVHSPIYPVVAHPDVASAGF